MITGRQIQAARALLGWSQQDLADKAIISRSAVNRLEKGKVDPRASTIEKVRRVLEGEGIEFLHDDSEGVRFRKHRPSR